MASNARSCTFACYKFNEIQIFADSTFNKKGRQKLVNLENRKASTYTALIPSPRILIAGLPLVAGSALISISASNIAFSEGAFIMEWIGTFLAFYGLSTLTGPRKAISLSGVILVAGIIGDIVFLGGMTPVDWVLANYMVFIHAALGSLAGQMIAKMQS